MKQLFDCNAHLGNWPFRQLRHNRAAGLLKLMDRAGIARAVVSSIDSIFYKNCQPGNIDVFRQIRQHRKRLIPFAVINPHYAGWDDDLNECNEKYGIKGLTLYPSVHGYSLRDTCADELLEQAEKFRLPVAVSLRILDRRQGHWLFQVPHVDPKDLAYAAKRHPNISFIVRDAGVSVIEEELIKIPNCYFDISRFGCYDEEPLIRLLSKSSPEKFLFGTQIPFKDPMPVLLKMQLIELPAHARNKIQNTNIARLIKKN